MFIIQTIKQNWKSIVIITLSLANLLNLGIAKSGLSTAQIDRLELQAQTDEESVTVTQTLGPDGGSIIVDFMGQPREVYVASGTLRYNVAIKVTVTKQVDKSYHDREIIEKFYPIEYLEYVSPRIIVELPMDAVAVDWEKRQGARGLFGVDPKYFDPDFDNESYVSAEIRTTTSEGYDSLDSMPYHSGGWFAMIYATNLRISYHDKPPETLKISVQIVDRKALFEDSD